MIGTPRSSNRPAAPHPNCVPSCVQLTVKSAKGVPVFVRPPLLPFEACGTGPADWTERTS